jgi:glycerate kinase
VAWSSFVLDAVRFDDRLSRASAVLTGEGAIDATSLGGKAVGEVALRALRAGVPCHAVVGRDELEGPGRERFASIAEAGTAVRIARAAAAAIRA